MKNIYLAIIGVTFLVGCATSQPESFISTSSPIFILNKPNDNTVFIDFKDLSDKDDIGALISKTLKNSGYRVIEDEKNASILVKGNINYFKENKQNNTHGYFGVGFGFDSHGRRSREVEFGLSHRFSRSDFYDDYGEIFSGQASLLLRVKSGKKFENYSTNINFQTDENSHSYSYAKSLFNKQVADKILEFLKFGLK